MNLKEQEAVELVDKFKRDFYNKFKVIPLVEYKLLDTHMVSLELIRAACEKVLKTLETKYYENGIKTVTNDASVLICRYIYSKIALDSGHQETRAARFLGLNNSLAKYGKGRINHLLSSGDEKALKVYEAVKIELDKLTFDNV